MPLSNIHWKGYPHRHLPKIRVTSSTRQGSVQSRIAHTAAINVLRVPLGSVLDQARRKQRLKSRRRRVRSSRTCSVLRARRRVSQRARQNIEVFGWATPLAELSRKDSYLTADSKSNIVKDTPKTDPGNSNTQSSFVASTDGAGGSVAKKFASTKPRSIPKKNVYSLMQVPEAPVYWGLKGPADVKKPRSTRRADAEYAHVGPLGMVSKGATNSGTQRSRTYDPRITPEKPAHRPSPSKPPTDSPRSAESQKKRSQALGSPEFWEAVDTNFLPLEDPGSSSSIKSTVKTIVSEAPSRTHSQRKALRRFTKELELYIQASRSMPKQSLVASPLSSTDDSMHTIQELKPYKEEFQSAGLAVTSADQRRKSNMPLKKPLADPLLPPPTPPKDEKWKKKSQPGDQQETIGDYKKPDESEEPYLSMDSISSDGTIIEFTPPHEMIRTQTQVVISKTPTKKSLPWLQKTKPFPEFNPAVVRKSATSELPEKSDVSSPPQNRVTPPIEKWKDKQKSLTPGEVRRNTNIKWDDVKYNMETTNGSNDQRKSTNEQMLVETDTTNREATQTDEEILDSEGTVRTPVSNGRNKTFPPTSPKWTGNCETSQDAQRFLNEPALNRRSARIAVDQAIQTEDIQRPDNDQTKIVRQECAPITSGRSKTLPSPSTKCTDNYEASRQTQMPFNELASNKRSARRELDRGTQTEDIQSSDNNQFKSIQGKESPFNPNVKIDDGSSTFPLTPKRNNNKTAFGPFRVPPAALSPRKSLDDNFNTTVTKSPSNTPSKPMRDEPPRRTPPPSLRCVQCSGEIPNPPISVSEAEPKPVAPQSEPELNQFPEPVPRGGLLHACTTYSLLQCQQCVSSKSFTVSKASSPPHSTLQTRAPSRRLTNKALPKTPIERARGRVPSEIIAEYLEQPIPDPVKKSSPKQNAQKRRTAAEFPHRHAKYIYLPTPPTPPTPPLPLIPVLLDTVHCHDVVSPNSSMLSYARQDNTNITDKDVFRGLHVATAAACDEDVDKWLEEVTGYGVRKLLADLSAFDDLGVNSLAGVAKRAARQRRDELRAREKLREERCCDDKCGEREEGVHVGNDKNDKKVLKESEEVMDGIVKMKVRKEAEGMRDRAVEMGWMNRSLSGSA